MSVNLVDELSELYREVEPIYFYRQIFPKGELDEKNAFTKGKYTGIACEITKDKKKKKTVVHRATITDDLVTIKELLKSNNFVILSPISYVGKSRTTENAAKMYAFCIEIDNLRKDKKTGRQDGFYDLIHQFTDIDLLPTPNYIVASGHGLHLYYVFEQPLNLYKNVKKSLINFKKAITPIFWNKYVTTDWRKDKIQFESPFQGFRLAGGVTKNGDRTRIFEVSTHPTSPEHLNKFVPDEKNQIDTSYINEYTLNEAKEQFPEWYEKRVINHEKKGRWVCKRDLYDWWKRQIEVGAVVGHRYYCLFCLSIYAIKCNISEDELTEDMYYYLDRFDKISDKEDNRFTEKDVMDALQAYYDKDLVTYPIGSIEYTSGIPIERNKRNFRKKSDHIKMVNATRKFRRDVLNEDEYKNNGRPKGSSKQKDMVIQWRMEHPAGKKADCIRDTGLSKPTVYRWWCGGNEKKI